MSKPLGEPSQCGSVVERQPMNQEVTGTLSQSGHMPRLKVRSPIGGKQSMFRIDISMFLSPSPSPSKIKIFFKKGPGLSLSK